MALRRVTFPHAQTHLEPSLSISHGSLSAAFFSKKAAKNVDVFSALIAFVGVY